MTKITAFSFSLRVIEFFFSFTPGFGASEYPFCLKALLRHSAHRDFNSPKCVDIPLILHFIQLIFCRLPLIVAMSMCLNGLMLGIFVAKCQQTPI